MSDSNMSDPKNEFVAHMSASFFGKSSWLICLPNMSDSKNEPRFLWMSDSMSDLNMSDSMFRGRHISHELLRVDSMSDPNMLDSRESVALFSGVCSSIAKVIDCACVCCACVYFEFLCDAFFSCV